MLSATWFPPNQRTTATAIQVTSNFCGVSVAFVLGPQLVSDSASVSVDTIKTQILHYMWIQTAFAAVIFIATLIYFPSRPPNAPFRSANTQRESFVSGLKQLMRHRQFWLIAFAYGIMTGTYSGWGSYLEPNLQSFLDQSKAQDESGWLGFYGTIAGCVGAIGLGMFADTFAGKMKV